MVRKNYGITFKQFKLPIFFFFFLLLIKFGLNYSEICLFVTDGKSDNGTSEFQSVCSMLTATMSLKQN